MVMILVRMKNNKIQYYSSAEIVLLSFLIQCTFRSSSKMCRLVNVLKVAYPIKESEEKKKMNQWHKYVRMSVLAVIFRS